MPTRNLWRAIAFALSISVLGAGSIVVAAAEPVPDSYIVTFSSGVSDADQLAAITNAGGTDVSSIPQLRMHSITFPAATSTSNAATLSGTSGVVRVDLDRTRAAEGTPSDAHYADQWSLATIGWDQLFGSVVPSGHATVAVLDTGVDGSHQDLAGQLVTGTSILDGSNGLTDPNGHGTAMAGIIAAATDNGVGVAGVGYAGVSVMPVTVLAADGTGQDSDIITGVVYAVDHGADVISMSFSNPGYSASLQAAIDYAWAHDVVVVAATGNDGSSTATFPAGDRGVVGVSNTDQNDSLNASSNYGQDTFLGAPGTDIWTTSAGGGYASITGTSASAAEVAAAAALLRANHPNASNGVIVNRMAESADPAGTTDQTGNGRLNLARAWDDTSTTSVQPAGAAPVGGGGPFVGPYTIASPTNSAVFPASGGSYNATSWKAGCVAGVDDMCGSATRSGGAGTVSQVQYSLQQGSGNYWNGTSFGSATEVLINITITAGGTVNWNVPFAFTNFPADGSYTLKVVSTQTVNQAGSTTNTFTFAIDTVAPTVTSINRVTASPTNGTTAQWTVTFSESTTGGASGNFTLTTTGTASGTFSTISGSPGTTRTVTYNSVAGDGTLRLDVSSTSGITDLAGNALSATFNTGQTITVDHTGPTVTAFTCVPAPGTINSTSLNCSVTFSDAPGSNAFSTASDVTVAGTSTTWSKGAASGSGAGPYTFTVTRGSPNSSGTLTLQVVASAINDAAGNNSTASSTLSYTIDTTAPTVSAFSCVPAPGTTNSTSLNCSVTFSEAPGSNAFDSTTSDLTIGGASSAWTSGATSGSGTGPYTFTVSRNTPNTDGTLTLQIAAGAINDAAGNTSAASTLLSYTINTATTTSLAISPATVLPGGSTTLTATLKRNVDNTALVGQTIYLTGPYADSTTCNAGSGTSIASGSTVAGGTFASGITAPNAGGTFFYRADYIGDGTYTGSFGCQSLVVEPGTTTTVSVSPNPVAPATPTQITVTGHLVRKVDNAVMVGENLSLSGPYADSATCSAGGGTFISSGATDGSGNYASLPFAAPSTGGTYYFRADYAGANGFTASFGCNTLVVDGATSTALLITPAGPVAGSASLSLKATLTSHFDGGALASQAVDFSGPYTSLTLCQGGAGTVIPGGTTDGTGVYTATGVTGPATSGTFFYRANYAGDATYAASFGCASIVVNAATTTVLAITPAVVLPSGSASFTATLASNLNGVLNGETVSISGPYASNALCQTGGLTSFASGTTNASGQLTGSITAPAANGTYSYRADFLGDANYTASFGCTTLSVDTAPTVSSTSAGSTNGNVSVTFSESVSLNATPITISCSSTGSHTYTQSPANGNATTFTFTANGGFTEGESCSVVVDHLKVHDADTLDPPDTMDADYPFNFTVDSAPTIVSTFPADGTFGDGFVASNANILITFSEAVTPLDSGWFAITCQLSGTHSGTGQKSSDVSGVGTSTVTINPRTDFTAGEFCVVAIDNTKVHDADSQDPPDTIANPYSFQFQVDAPPTVISNTPLPGSSYTLSTQSVTIGFDQSVNVATGWVTLSCTVSGAHTYTQAPTATTGTAWTLTPDSPFVAGDSCTATVVSTQVTDVDSADPPDTMTANFAWTWSYDAAPSVTAQDTLDSATLASNGLVAVDNDSLIKITFNEQVTTDLGWFSVTCTPTAGSPTTPTYSQSPTVGLPGTIFTVDADGFFPDGSTCQVTIDATKVHDTDTFDPPDTMVANKVFSFTVFDPPTVTTALTLTATPANVGYPGTVVFSGTFTLTPSSATVQPNMFVTLFISDNSNCSQAGSRGTATITANPNPGGGTYTFPAFGVFPTPGPGTYYFQTTFDKVTMGGKKNRKVYTASTSPCTPVTFDSGPSISSTVPTNGANPVKANTTVSITFSEPVNFTNDAATILCGSTGFTATPSGTGTATITLAHSDFTQGATCTVTLDRTKVTDVDTIDDNPTQSDQLQGPNTFSFTIDAAPFVVSTIPADQATGVALDANIAITFSEKVQRTGTWFTISCADSGSHAATASSVNLTVQQVVTLDPTLNFAGGELCTVTVIAAQVTDQDNVDPPDNMLANYVFTFTTTAEVPTVTTAVHDSLHNLVPPAIVLRGDTVHDSALVSNNTTKVPAGSSFDYHLYSGNGCTGNSIADWNAVALTGGALTETKESPATAALNAGLYSYKVHFNSGNTAKDTNADAACENFTITDISSTLTEVHRMGIEDQHFDGDLAGLGLASQIHDHATVSTTDSTALPVGSTITVAFYSGNDCGTTGSLIDSESGVSLTGASGSSAESSGTANQANTLPLHAGTYSYLVSFHSGNTTLVADSTATCEWVIINKRVVDSLTTAVQDGDGNTYDNASPAPLGTVLHDVATVTGNGVSGFEPTGTVSFSFYGDNSLGNTGTPDCTGNSPADAGTIALDGNDPGTADSNATDPLHAGNYAYMASYSGDSDYYGYTPVATTDCEPFSVAKANLSTFSTAIHDATHATPAEPAPLGSSLHDTATGSGVFTPTGTVHFTLYGANTVGSDNTGDCTDQHTTSLDTKDFDGTGLADGSTATGALHTGLYAFTAHYDGSADYNVADSECEQFSVAKAELTSFTTAFHSDTHVVVTSPFTLGSTLHDTATATGDFTPTGTVTFTLYGKNTLDNGNTGDCSDPNSTPWGTTSLDGSGVADGSDDTGFLHAGGYAFKAHYNGDGDYNETDSACEPFTVNKADLDSFTTEIRNASNSVFGGATHAPLGSVLHDVALSTGADIPGFEPTGSVSFTYYGTNELGNTDTPTCAETDNSGDAGSASFDGADPGTADGSDPTAALHAGNYAFSAHYEGSSDYNEATSDCENVTVDKANLSTFFTTIHDASHATAANPAPLGSDVHDSATGTGPITPTGTVHFTFYGVNEVGAENTGDCSDENSAGAGSADFDASGVADSSTSTGALHAGDYAFSAHYDGTADYNAKDAACEKFTVAQGTVASVTTTIYNAGDDSAAANPAPLGTSVYDKATVSGAFTPTGTVTFTFYGANTVGSNNTGDCTDANYVAAGVKLLDGSGISAASDSAGPLHAGKYAYKAHYSGNSDYAASDAACEQFTVSKGDVTGFATTVHDSSHNPITSPVALASIVHDSAKLNGFFTPTGSVTFTLYGSNTAGNSNVGDCNVVGNDSSAAGSPVNLDGTAAADGSAATAALHAGKYAYKAHYNGSADFNEADGACEKFEVSKANLTAFTTEIRNGSNAALVGSAPLGATLHDTATATGNGLTGFTPTGIVSFNFFGSNALGNTGTPDCTSGGAGAGSHALDASAFADGSSATLPLHAGNYAFQATYPGSGDYNSTTSSCENFTVAKGYLASLTTAIHLGATHSGSLSSVALGSTPHDSATATGLALSGFTPTGSVSFTLYGSNTLNNTNVGDCSDATSTALGWANLDSSGVADPSTATAALHGGKYGFKAYYGGSADYFAKTATCEQFTVNKATLTLSNSLHDSAHNVLTSPLALNSTPHASTGVTGIVSGFAPSLNLTYTLYGANTVGNTNVGNCADATTTSLGSQAINGSGVADGSSATAALHAGYFGIKAFYAGDGDYAYAASACSAFRVVVGVAICTVTPYNVTYDTFAHTATGSCKDSVNNQPVSGLDLSHTTHTVVGTYSTDYWTFANPDYPSQGPITITDVITPRAALVNYIGQQYWVTSGSSSTTVQVTLAASAQDPTGYSLVGATMTFKDAGSGAILAANVPVSPVPGNPSTGTASKIVTLNTGNYGAQIYMIEVTMGGQYTNALQPETDKTYSIVVTKPASASQTTGGGTIAKFSSTAGTYGVTSTSTPAVFSVGITYNKSLTNLQGQIMIAVEQTDGSIVYIKSNSLSTMSVSTGTAGKTSVIYAKCSIYKITQGVTTSLDGGASLRMDVLDTGTTTPDKVGFTVLSSKNSTLQYSSAWELDTTVTPNVWKTVLKPISTGGVQVVL